MAKFADDAYLTIVPASNYSSCASEITNVEQWANNNNLALNRGKSTEIVFVAPRSRRELTIPPPITGFDRVDVIKALGVSFTRKLSVTPHVDELLAACTRTFFALRTLRQHGLPRPERHHTRHLPGHSCRQVDVCISGLVGLCKCCR